MIRQTRAQVTVETTLVILVGVLALVGMTLYFQRAYQGYLHLNSAAQGAQFDPREQYTVVRFLNVDQTSKVTIKAGPRANIVKGIPGLPSVPGGPSSHLSVQTTETTSNWTMLGSGAYVANQ